MLSQPTVLLLVVDALMTCSNFLTKMYISSITIKVSLNFCKKIVSHIWIPFHVKENNFCEFKFVNKRAAIGGLYEFNNTYNNNQIYSYPLIIVSKFIFLISINGINIGMYCQKIESRTYALGTSSGFTVESPQ